MPVIATLSGPNYWAPNHDESSIEVHTDALAAAESLKERYVSNGQTWQTVIMLNGHYDRAMYPTMDGCKLDIYRVDELDDTGRVSVEAGLSAVHTGAPDYIAAVDDDGTVTLTII